ncbi:hypothetical protein D3C87_191210 [compost metagenome]
MLKQLLLSILLVFSFSVFSQGNKLEKVSKEELLEKIHVKDTAASAAILYKKGKTYFEISNRYWIMVTEVYTRIKIYKKEGYEYANGEITFYSGDKKANATFVEGNTYDLVGGTIVKTGLKPEGQFEEYPYEGFTTKKIVLPNVKEGSVVEYKYVIRTPYFTNLEDWYFQYDIPVNSIIYEVKIPAFFNYNIYTKGNQKISNLQLKPERNDKIEGDETTYIYETSDVSAFKDEGYINNKENYISMLKHELASVHLPNTEPVYYANDWTTVANSIYENENFGRELRFSSYFEKDVDVVIKPEMSAKDKAAAIFEFVKARMNWNEKNGYLCKQGVKKAYESRQGNVAEINLMLTAMLRYAGFNANPVLVSTRANGVAIYPTRTAYNYVVTAVDVENNGEVMLLDATSKYALPNIMPTRALNWNGRMITKNGKTAEINLMPNANSKEVVQMSVEMDKDGKVSGKIRDQYYDYYAYRFRENHSENSKDANMDRLEAYYKGMIITDYTTLNAKDLTKPVTEEYSFSHDGVIDMIGGKIFFNPMLFFAQTVNPFKSEKREYPIDFNFPRQDKYLINIKLPEGYAVETLPAPLSLVMEQNIGSFKYNIVNNGGHLQLSVSYDINYANVSQDYYGTIRDFYKKMVEKQTEKVVLKKT